MEKSKSMNKELGKSCSKMSKEQCPYCSIDNGTELFTCDGSDYFISVSIDKSSLRTA